MIIFGILHRRPVLEEHRHREMDRNHTVPLCIAAMPTFVVPSALSDVSEADRHPRTHAMTGGHSRGPDLATTWRAIRIRAVKI